MILLSWALAPYKVNSYPESVISFLFCFDMEKESNDQVIIFTLRLVEWTLPSRVGFRRRYSSQEREQGWDMYLKHGINFSKPDYGKCILTSYIKIKKKQTV